MKSDIKMDCDSLGQEYTHSKWILYIRKKNILDDINIGFLYNITVCAVIKFGRYIDISVSAHEYKKLVAGIFRTIIMLSSM